MVIKNKDGSIFKLNGPNPVMESQELWTNYIVHNLKFSPDAIEVIEKQAEEIPLPKEEIKKQVEEIIEETPESIEPPKPEFIPERFKKDLIFCTPAIVEEKTDDFYGDKFNRIKYGESFVFEAVIFETSDLTIQFWTNVTELPVSSVIYPKNQEKRWWKIVSTEEKTGGWTMKGIPSNYQPSFNLKK